MLHITYNPDLKLDRNPVFHLLESRSFLDALNEALDDVAVCKSCSHMLEARMAARGRKKASTYFKIQLCCPVCANPAFVPSQPLMKSLGYPLGDFLLILFDFFNGNSFAKLQRLFRWINADGPSADMRYYIQKRLAMTSSLFRERFVRSAILAHMISSASDSIGVDARYLSRITAFWMTLTFICSKTGYMVDIINVCAGTQRKIQEIGEGGPAVVGVARCLRDGVQLQRLVMDGSLVSTVRSTISGRYGSDKRHLTVLQPPSICSCPALTFHSLGLFQANSCTYGRTSSSPPTDRDGSFLSIPAAGRRLSWPR